MHQSIFLPGVAVSVCFNSITDPTAEFHLFNEKNKDIYQLFKQNIVGGPSIIFNGYPETRETFIQNNRDKPRQKIISYDAIRRRVLQINSLLFRTRILPQNLTYFIIKFQNVLNTGLPKSLRTILSSSIIFNYSIF